MLVTTFGLLSLLHNFVKQRKQAERDHKAEAAPYDHQPFGDVLNTAARKQAGMSSVDSVQVQAGCWLFLGIHRSACAAIAVSSCYDQPKRKQHTDSG